MADIYLFTAADTAVSDQKSQETAEKLQSNMGLVHSIAGRFEGRGVEYDDLVQLGSIGLLKAIRTFDPARGNAFSTYAVPLIIGEIRRFLRDDGLVKVSRIHKKNAAILLHKREEWIAAGRGEPHLCELADACGMTEETATEALMSSQRLRSLSEPVGEDGVLENLIENEDNEIDKQIESEALRESIKQLPALWQSILLLRYKRDYSQTETALALGLTQVKVSREEKKIMAALREKLQ